MTVGDSRLDILLTTPGRRHCYVEIKSATLRVGDHAAFPDAVTERGRKHLRALAELAAAGHRAGIFYFVRPADEVDPAYGETLRQVVAAGVEALAYRMRFSRRRVQLVDRLPIDLE